MPSLYSIKLPVFEGPLDLLLQLIQREELDITTVALAKVTDQYMARLAEMGRRESRDLADFLVVAAKLLLIKSAALLPSPSASSTEEDAKEVGEELIRQLQIYKRYKDIASLLREREEKGFYSYIRLVPLPRREPELDMGDVTVQDLLGAAREAMDVVTGPPVGDVVSPVSVTIDEQIAFIKRQLSRQPEVPFRALLSRVNTRIEVVVTLLAVLELIKQDRVRVRQERLFDEIVIMKGAESIPDDGLATNPAT